ncbi:MAG: DUF4159 domain-containing protein [Planctomycetota bacterium]
MEFLNRVTRWYRSPAYLSVAAVALAALSVVTVNHSTASAQTSADDAGLVRAAKLVYANNKSSVCFSENFLKLIAEETHIRTHPELASVKSESGELFEYPFAVMTGEGAFTLTDSQIDNLRTYMTYGGFVIASAGCSSKDWNRSYGKAISQIFPDAELVTLDADHPIFHTVYDITSSKYKSGGARLPELRALELDGRVVMIWSPDGLNDTANAPAECCCCGGNEIKSSRQLNVNILAYALTH